MADDKRYLPIDVVTRVHFTLGNADSDDLLGKLIDLLEDAYAQGYSDGAVRASVEHSMKSLAASRSSLNIQEGGGE